MNKQSKKPQSQDNRSQDSKESTIDDVFELIDAVAQEAKSSESARELIDSAAREYEISSRYAF